MNALSRTGKALADGSLPEARAAASGPWVADLKAASAALSPSEGAAAAVEAALGGAARLASAASLDDAKRAYIVAAKALTDWAALAGVASKLQGL